MGLADTLLVSLPLLLLIHTWGFCNERQRPTASALCWLDQTLCPFRRRAFRSLFPQPQVSPFRGQSNGSVFFVGFAPTERAQDVGDLIGPGSSLIPKRNLFGCQIRLARLSSGLDRHPGYGWIAAMRVIVGVDVAMAA